MTHVARFIRSFVAEEDGATMVEYGLMVALIAVVVASIVVTLGTDLKTKFTTADTCVATNVCP